MDYNKALADLHEGGAKGADAAAWVFGYMAGAHPEQVAPIAIKLLALLGCERELDAKFPTASPLPPRLAFSVRQAAEAVGISPTSLRRQILAGQLGAVTCGSKTLIPHSELVDWFASLPAWEPEGPNYARGPKRS